MHDYEYEGVRRLVYGGPEIGATFVPVCETCGRFVKGDDTIRFNGLGEKRPGPNATCSKCGRVEMLFEGYE